MSVISLLAVLIGIAIGAVLGFLFARSREASAATGLAARASAAEERAHAASERAALVEGQLAERFQSLSAQALDASTRRFLEMAEGRLDAANAKAAGELETRRAAVENLVGPLKETLARVESQLRDSDAERVRSHAALAEQVHIARQSSDQLRIETQALVTALRRPEARGRWGEMQLRRVVELAGMSSRCDFDEQVGVATDDGALRPDMVVRLAGGKNIVVDSKVSLAAYLEAAEAADQSLRQTRLGAHARHLREHVDRLAAKAYWDQFASTPELVVMFIPGESFVGAAAEADPALIEDGMARKVVVATPTTLIALLRAIAYGWRQEQVAANAEQIRALGSDLYNRLRTMAGHFESLGGALGRAVGAYNSFVGSMETRVLPAARRFRDLGATSGEEIPPLPAIEQAPRQPDAPEFPRQLTTSDVPPEEAP